jgi:putative aldouronate transport system permease protein
MMVPGLAFLFVFNYLPMYGILIAFKEFDIDRGILGSPWAGLKYFRQLVEIRGIWNVVYNTLRISLLKIVIMFPFPILFALLLNEIRHMRFKRVVQTISYLPHFLSWVIVAGLVMDLLSPSTGVAGLIMRALGLQPQVLLTNTNWFVPILIVSEMWKEVGWGVVVFLASIAGIDPSLYESARIDGAGRFKQAIHITLPGLVPVITVLFILNAGGVFDAGFDQIFNLYSPLVYSVADIIDTYIYRMGLTRAQYSFATALGLVRNLISFGLIVFVNFLARRSSEYALW